MRNGELTTHLLDTGSPAVPMEADVPLDIVVQPGFLIDTAVKAEDDPFAFVRELFPSTLLPTTSAVPQRTRLADSAKSKCLAAETAAVFTIAVCAPPQPRYHAPAPSALPPVPVLPACPS